jgi:cysteinyl-tRNA synthetase
MVHHQNEIAQTLACHGTRLAQFWMHGYFLQVDEARMGKSVGNFLRLQTLVDRGYDPLAWRLFCLSAHYRSKLNFTWDSLDGASTALHRLRAAAHEWGAPGTPDDEFVNDFTEQIHADLNMPRALAVTWDLVKSDLDVAAKKATLLAFDRVLGLRLAEAQPLAEVVPDDVMALVERRAQARHEKRWSDADTLRAQALELGYDIEDTPHGPSIRPRKRIEP